MGIFDSLFGRPRHSEFEIMAKAWAALQAYQKMNFSFAAKLFAEYFSMKGYGIFPKLDADDYQMYINLMLSQFYAQMYEDTIATCKKIQIIKPHSGDSFAFQALSEKALGKLIESECDVPSVPSVPNVPDVPTGPNVAAAAEPGVHFSRPLFCEVAD